MRKVPCSRCIRMFSRGTTRVRRFVVFHFCEFCWTNRRGECDSIMVRATEVPCVHSFGMFDICRKCGKENTSASGLEQAG